MCYQSTSRSKSKPVKIKTKSRSKPRSRSRSKAKSKSTVKSRGVKTGMRCSLRCNLRWGASAPGASIGAIEQSRSAGTAGGWARGSGLTCKLFFRRRKNTRYASFSYMVPKSFPLFGAYMVGIAGHTWAVCLILWAASWTRSAAGARASASAIRSVQLWPRAWRARAMVAKMVARALA